MEDVYRLCHDYKKHLENAPYLSSYPDELTKDKLKIIESLLLCRTPKEIKNLLSDPQGPRYQMILQKNRSDWTWTFIVRFLTVITMPISLPVLLAWSWIVRGDPNFLKSDGAILVDKLLRISEANLSVSPINIDIINTTPETSQLRASSMDNQLPRQKPSRFHGMASLLARHTLKQDNSDALSSPVPVAIDTTPNLYAAMFEKDILNDTGKPQFLASRARPFSYSRDDYLVVDSYCGFKYSNQAPRLVTINVVTHLDPIVPRLSEEGYEPQQTEQPPNEGVVTSMCQLVHGLFFFTPTFESMFKEAQIDRGYYTTRQFYEKALNLATNDRQRILAIEGIINQLDRKYVIEQADQQRYIGQKKFIDSAPAWGQIVPEHLRDEAALLGRTERNQKRMDETLALIEHYYNQLPANYRAMTPSANRIQGIIDSVFELIERDDIGKARLHYLSIPQFTPFLKLAFPHLLAMEHLMGAIFCLLSTHGYHVWAYQGEPFTEELRPHSLSVYLSGGLICCSARTDDAIDRFIISDEALGSEASAIRECLSNERGVFSDHQDQIIFEAVANRGYYRDNEPVPIEALNLFEEAHALVQYYNPDLARHFEQMTLAPLRALMQAGEVAKKNTPYAVRKALSEKALAERRKRMSSGDTYIPFHQLNDDEWSELLATTDTTHAYHSY